MPSASGQSGEGGEVDLSNDDGTCPIAGFVIKEASIFVEAQAWENTSIFFEIQTNVLQRDHDKSVRTGEIYINFQNVLKRWADGFLNIKAGRIDIPFGDEYLWQDAHDNRLVSNSAPYPWNRDEGIALYGKIGAASGRDHPIANFGIMLNKSVAGV